VCGNLTLPAPYFQLFQWPLCTPLQVGVPRRYTQLARPYSPALNTVQTRPTQPGESFKAVLDRFDVHNSVNLWREMLKLHKRHLLISNWVLRNKSTSGWR
jgi:hypothetical protein